MKVLSEEEIQKKLYGAYKPGTLGKLVKINGADLQIDLLAEKGRQQSQANLFPDVHSEFARKIKDGKKIYIDSERTVGDIEKLRQEPLSGISQNYGQSTDAELLQVDTRQAMATAKVRKPRATSDSWASFKLTLLEIFDRLKTLGTKFYLTVVIVLICFVLSISLFSTHVGKSARDYEKSSSDESAVDGIVVVSEAIEDKDLSLQQTMDDVSPRQVVAIPVLQESVQDNATTQSSMSALPDFSLSENPPMVVPTAFYSVQVCASNDLMATEKLIENLKLVGLDAFYKTIQTSRGKELYLVYAGRFSDKIAAESGLREYSRLKELRFYKDSYIVKLDPER